MRMWYWNQENFEGLERVAQLATNHGLSMLADYCRLRVRGLRNQALQVLRAFVTEQQKLPVSEARRVADVIMTIQSDNPEVHSLLAQPLWNGFLRPLLEEWKRESDSLIPRRWLGIHAGNTDLLREVLDRDPADTRARVILVARLIGHVDHATHHLVEGRFLGKVADALSDLEDIRRHLHHITELPVREPLEKDYQALSLLVADWQEFNLSGTGDFRDWCESRGHKHGWWSIVHYKR